MLSFRPRNSRRPEAVIAVALALALTLAATTPAQAQRPAAPAGYAVTYSLRSGKPLPDGKLYRIVLVTRSQQAAVKQRDYLNTFHVYQARLIELRTEADYQRAEAMQRGQNAPRPRPPAPAPAPQGGKVEGSKYQVGSNVYTFKRGGMVTDKYGSSGTWSQSGNTVKWSVQDGPFKFYYRGTVSASGEMMSVYSQTYNPRTGNSGQEKFQGNGRRVP